MSIFEAKDYRSYLKVHIKGLPNKGRGELSRIAHALNVNTTLLSQIFAGTRDFNLEQGLQLSKYLGHTELETEFFLLMVQVERAGTHDLKLLFQKKMQTLKTEALKLSKRITTERTLDEHEKSVFYSSWIYSATHLFTSLSAKGVSVEDVCERFDISRSKANEILQFLLRSGLCTEDNGRFKMGVQSTFVSQGSPHLLKHHSNWRVKAIQKSESLKEKEMMFTGQVSISEKDFAELREHLTNFIKQASEKVQKSKPDEIACLNIDWFWL